MNDINQISHDIEYNKKEIKYAINNNETYKFLYYPNNGLYQMNDV